MTFTSKYGLGEIVYIKTDKEQLPRMVTEILFSGDGGTVYTLSQGTYQSSHFEIEITNEKDELLPLTY